MHVNAADDKGQCSKQAEESPDGDPAATALQAAQTRFAAEPFSNFLLGVGQPSAEAMATSDDKGSDTKGRRAPKGDPKLPEEGARRSQHFLRREPEHAGQEEDEPHERRNWHSQMADGFHLAEAHNGRAERSK